jgi:2-methylisocitrate lyase-like PEP mutase family enzyme
VTKGDMLRTAVTDRPLLVLPGAADPLTARVLADTGFGAVYATGAGIANVAYAWPDLGLLGMSEVVAQVGRIAEAAEVPVLADADTGYGGPLNVARTVRELERAGVAGIQIEDQVSPKRCGHFAGTQVVDEAEMLARIRTALAARRDSSTLVVGRTDATATLGLDAAIRRGRLLAAAGVDLVFVEAPTRVEDLARIPAEIDAPTLVNVVEGGRTPQLPAADYEAMGFAVALYANTAMRLALQAVRAGAAELLRTGDTLGLTEAILPWEERQRLVRTAEFDQLAADLQTAGNQRERAAFADSQEAGTA